MHTTAAGKSPGDRTYELRGHSKPLAADGRVDGQREASEIGRGVPRSSGRRSAEPRRLLPYHWCADKMKHTSDKITTANLKSPHFISLATNPAQSVVPGRTQSLGSGRLDDGDRCEGSK
jgi:hypothetical protein